VGEADLAEITCVYSGADTKEGEDEKANAVYTMGLSLSEEPILAHQYFTWTNQSVTNELNTVRRLVESPGFNHDSCDCEDPSYPPT
jgi:hypothetical protein